MSSIKLKHSSGNSMSIAAPASNPASDLTLTLPTNIGAAGKVLSVNGSGNLDFIYPSGYGYFQAYATGNNQNLSHDTVHDVTLTAETFDSQSWYDTSTSRYTPQVAGKYYIYGKLSFDDTNIAANTDEHMAKVYKNGSQESVYYKFATGNDNYLVFAEVLDLDGDDYIEIYAKINNSNGGRVVRGASANQKYTTFGAFRITGV